MIGVVHGVMRNCTLQRVAKNQNDFGVRKARSDSLASLIIVHVSGGNFSPNYPLP